MIYPTCASANGTIGVISRKEELITLQPRFYREVLGGVLGPAKGKRKRNGSVDIEGQWKSDTTPLIATT
jgi:hypothetical protein